MNVVQMLADFVKWYHGSILCKQIPNQWLELKVDLVIIKLPNAPFQQISRMFWSPDCNQQKRASNNDMWIIWYDIVE